MRYNIIGQSIFQMSVLLFLLFRGAGSLCDCMDDDRDEAKCTDINCPHCRVPHCPNCGGFFNIPTGIHRSTKEPPTQHFTIIFNAFVMMQLFNWINCRKLNHEAWVLEGMFKTPIFCAIWAICFIIQILLARTHF